MTPHSFFRLIAATITLASALSALEGAEPGMPRAGIVLTFDDMGNLSRWAKQLPLFERYEAKATFFIERPDQLDESRKRYLKQLSDAGHEIGCHGFRHLRGSELLTKKGVRGYLDEEILPAKNILEELGYPQKSFAYPMSDRNEKTDEALKPLFWRVRGGGGRANKPIDAKDVLFTPVDRIRDRFVFIGIGMDYLTEEELEKNLLPGLERAQSRGEIVVFYAHGISDEEMKGHHIRTEMLEKLLKRVREFELEFHTLGGL